MSKEQKTDETNSVIPRGVNRSFLCLLLFCSLCVTLPLANAQTGSFDVSFGLGTAHAPASSTGIDVNTLLSCSPATDSSCESTPHLSGLMMGFDGHYMLTKQYGVGAEVAFQPAKQNYVVLSPVSSGFGENIESRLTFYDFNGFARPLRSKRASLELSGGFGGANLRFYDNITANTVLGNSSSSQAFTSANHFQLHFGAAVPIYVKDHFFVRPQFDLHYVPNFTQYGSDLVTQGMIYVGYSFGGQ